MKNIILSLLLLISTTTLWAQSFSGGVTAGLTACQIDGDNYGGFDKLGFSAGLFVNRTLNKTFSAQLELCYTMKGANSKNEYQLLSLHYVEIPILTQIDLSEVKPVPDFLKPLIFEIGLAPAIMIGQTNNGFPLDQELSSIDIAFAAGAGYDILKKLRISGRFTYTIIGLAPITAKYNNVFHISLHYFILREN